MNALHLHNARIEALVDQLYGINRHIMSIDGQMVKLADQARINRREFIDEYRGYELDPNWMDRMGEKQGRGWQAFIERSTAKVEELRGEMAKIGQYIGVDISEFRRIVQPGPEGREGGAAGQEGDGRGEPAPGHLDRQEVHEPRPAIP